MDVPAILIATLLGLWLRLWLAFSSGLWRDEVQGLMVSTLPSLGETLAFLRNEESHPPLFYLIERSWVAAFGSTDGSLVMLGMIPGVALIPLAGAVGWATSGRRAGVLAAWFTALAWPLVQQSGDARPYALLAFLALGATWAAFHALTRGSRAAWIWYVVACVGLLYSHNWAVLVVAALGLTAFFTLRTLHSGGATWWVVLRPWCAVHGAIALLYLPWLPSVVRQSSEAGYAPAARFPAEWFVVAPTVALGLTVGLLVPAVLVIVLGAVGRDARAPRPSAALFLGWVAVLPCFLAAATWRFSLLTVTNCLVILAPVALTAVAVLMGKETGAGIGGRRLAAAASFLAILGASLAMRWLPKSNIRAVADFVSERAGTRDLVIVHSALIGPAFRRYAGISWGDLVAFPPQFEGGPVRFRDWGRHLSGPGDLEAIRQKVQTAGREGAGLWIVSEVRDYGVADSAAPVGTRQWVAYRMEKALDELRSIAVRTYGEADFTLSPDGGRRTRERIRVDGYLATGDDL